MGQEREGIWMNYKHLHQFAARLGGCHWFLKTSLKDANSDSVK